MHVSVLAVKAGHMWLHTNIHKSTNSELEELRATTIPATISCTDNCGIHTDTLKQVKTSDSQGNCIFTQSVYGLLIKKSKRMPQEQKTN